MNTPLITWGCIVALVIIIMVINAIREVSKSAKRRQKFLCLGSEREEFYIPGDRDLSKKDNFDIEDYDDF